MKCKNCGKDLAENETKCSACGTDVVAEIPAEDVNVVTPVKGEDIKRLLEKVRNEEKKKIYPQVDHLKKEMLKLQQEKEALMKAIQDRSADDDKDKQKKLSEIEQVRQQLDALVKQNVELIESQKIMKEEAQKEIEAQRLRAYKSDAIRQAGAGVIPELVLGNSETEIDASIIASKQRYEEIKEDVRKQFKVAKSEVTVPGVTQPSQTNVSPGNATADTLTAEALRNMSNEDWAKERMNIRRQVDGSMKQFFQSK